MTIASPAAGIGDDRPWTESYPLKLFLFFFFLIIMNVINAAIKAPASKTPTATPINSPVLWPREAETTLAFADEVVAAFDEDAVEPTVEELVEV